MSVLVYAQVDEGRLSSASLELLGGGRRLADELGQDLAAVVLGEGVQPVVESLSEYPVDQVLVVEDSSLGHYDSELYLAALKAACDEVEPRLVLFPSSLVGKDLAPRLTYRLQGALANDCLDLAVEDGQLVITRPVFGGKAQAVMTSDRKVQLVTVRSGVFEAAQPGGGDPQVTQVAMPAAESSFESLGYEESGDDINLQDAPVIVSGGRGIGGPDNFDMLDELARLLGGTYGASLAAVDEGWVSPKRQVGQTGSVVSPDLYLAVGISGAMQHMAGCSSSKHIVAINTDKDAPIFSKAELGVVADYKDVVPVMIEEVKKLKS